MKELFLYIRNRLTSRIPGLTVELFNDQFNKANGNTAEGRSEMAIRYPVCYIEFIIESVDNLSMGVMAFFLRTRFRFGLESYKFERLETFDFLDDFYAAIHMMTPTDRNILNFTSFQAVEPEFDEDHNNVERPYIDYRTKLFVRAGQRVFIPKEEVTLRIGLEIEHLALLYEAHELQPLYFYEPAELMPVFIGE